MKSGLIFKMALATSLIGLFILILMTENLELPNTNIEDINKEHLEKQVKISGTVTSITNTQSIAIMNLKDNTDEIKVIAYKKEDLKIKKGQIIEVLGIVKEYENEIEIESSLIKIIA